MFRSVIVFDNTNRNNDISFLTGSRLSYKWAFDNLINNLKKILICLTLNVNYEYYAIVIRNGLIFKRSNQVHFRCHFVVKEAT